MKDISVIGLDLAKEILHLIGLNKTGKLVVRKKLRRNQVEKYFKTLPSCTIAMEGCASSHYWGRQFQQFGHQVKILPAQYVKAYVRGNKNDYNDALAIAEASQIQQMRAVKLKTPEQQGLQALHRIRRKSVGDRTSLCNQVRGLLAEFGIVLPRGMSQIRNKLPEILADETNDLPFMLRDALSLKYIQLNQLDELIEQLTSSIEIESKQHTEIKLLQTIPGYGSITASCFYSHVGDGRGYKQGRDVSAALGLVPRQHSSGDKQVLLGISKRGDKYLRSLLVHGARAVVRVADKKTDRLSQWVTNLAARRGKNKATIALANKLARIGWAVIRKAQPYHTTYAEI